VWKLLYENVVDKFGDGGRAIVETWVPDLLGWNGGHALGCSVLVELQRPEH
jgi:hypothetical protein